MHKIEVMNPHVGPPKCLICGRGNTPDDPDTMDDFWALDLERDVNWGDPAYICKYCVEDIAVMADFIPPEIASKMETKVQSLEEDLHEVEAKLEHSQIRRKAIIEGKVAEKETEEELGTKRRRKRVKA